MDDDLFVYEGIHILYCTVHDTLGVLDTVHVLALLALRTVVRY